MHPRVKALRRLWIDVSLPNNAAECRLDMSAGAAEAIVQVEVAEGGIHIIAPQQPNHPSAQPKAFRIASRAGHLARCLSEFLDLALGFLGGIGRLSRRLVATLGLAILGHGMWGA
jgi:hypothetical protein